MQASLGLGVFARFTATACALPAILISTLAVGVPTAAQAAPTLTCVTEVTGQDANGKTLLTLPGSFVGTRPDGSLIIAVDPACIGESVAPKYDDARRVVDDVVDQAKKAGVPAEVADRARDVLNDDVEAAKDVKDDPANQVNGANEVRVQKSAEHPDNGDDAMVAAIAGVAGLCMVASAGICAAAVAAILPSILPAKISSKDVQGIASFINDINQGKPVTPERIKAVIDVARKLSNASSDELSVLSKLAENGLKVAAEKALVDAGLSEDAAKKVIDVINNTISDGKFDCEVVLKAANITSPIQVADPNFVAKIVTTLESTRRGATVAADVRDCLAKYFDPN